MKRKQNVIHNHWHFDDVFKGLIIILFVALGFSVIQSNNPDTEIMYKTCVKECGDDFSMRVNGGEGYPDYCVVEDRHLCIATCNEILGGNK